jgi:glycosyltransferase involved in cell wall biosynthesis
MISVVIPTLNEAQALPASLMALQNERAEHETIVIDGGSRDATVEIASAYGARVLHAPSGRGSQLCAGAREAAGDILLFLHADSIFPAGGLSRIKDVLTSDILAHSLNLVLASTGGPDRAREHPWLPFLAADVELPQTVVAASYLFHQMPYVDEA